MSLINVADLLADYYRKSPDISAPEQAVCFGTSGHRGSSWDATFTESHMLAITQAVAEYRIHRGYLGPLILGMDTHALSEPAHRTAIEVLAANNITTWIQQGGGFTPTPVISHAVIQWNRQHTDLADGLILTPSHNPPQDGGVKYNPPSGGPADSETAIAIQNRANEILKKDLTSIKRISYGRAISSETTIEKDFITPYVEDLAKVIDMKRIADSGLKLGVDPMGGSGIAYWQPIVERYGLNLEVINSRIDPTFSFMPLDWDGKIRMDCSSPWAMAGLIKMKDKYDLAFGNDPDYDRHGILTKNGLMNPNHYLAVGIEYLFQNRPEWRSDATIGKSLATSAMIDRVAKSLGRKVLEMPVGFKWFVKGLGDGSCGFGGEESAGASFLRRNGSTWTTDKDGFILDLLAAEMMAKSGKSPAEHYDDLEEKFGKSFYKRTEAPANLEQRNRLKAISAQQVKTKELAGEPILMKLSHALGNGAPMGGLKIVTENAWFAARPSGTENIYKIYAESFISANHLAQVQNEAQAIVDSTLA